MRDLRKQERTAIEAVAKQFSAAWEKGDVSASAYLKVNGKRVAVEIATLKQRGTGRASAAKPHLRFDKVVLWLMKHLQVTLAKTVPDDATVLLTVTAPIRLPAKTAAALEGKIQTLLGRESPRRVARRREVKAKMHGNRIRIRVLRGNAQATKMIGFVHNPETNPLLLFNMTAEMLELVSAKAARRPSKPAPERWLVLISTRGISVLEAYRYIYSQLVAAADFKKVFVVFGDGRVGVLAE